MPLAADADRLATVRSQNKPDRTWDDERTIFFLDMEYTVPLATRLPIASIDDAALVCGRMNRSKGRKATASVENDATLISPL